MPRERLPSDPDTIRDMMREIANEIQIKQGYLAQTRMGPGPVMRRQMELDIVRYTKLFNRLHTHLLRLTAARNNYQ